MAPFALGTDTYGSLIIPATRASAFTIRPTHDMDRNRGVVPVARSLDVVGAITKSVKDLAIVESVLVSHPQKEMIEKASAAQDLSGLRVAVLVPEEWKFDRTLQEPDPLTQEELVGNTQGQYYSCLPLLG